VARDGADVDARQVRSPARVLVVEDSQMLARMLELTLNHGTFLTRSVATADEGLDLMADWRPTPGGW
jgi:CheY-like chemotaxis protein